MVQGVEAAIRCDHNVPVLEELSQLAELEDGHSQNHIGLMYEEGPGFVAGLPAGSEMVSQGV